MAVATGDTSGIDTKTLLQYVDVNSDPCVRLDGLVTKNLSNNKRELFHPNDTIDGKFASDFPGASAGLFLSVINSGTFGNFLGDLEEADQTKITLEFIMRGQNQYKTGKVFQECNPFVEIYAALRDHVFGNFTGQVIFPGSTSNNVPPDGASPGDSTVDGDTRHPTIENYVGDDLAGPVPRITMVVRDHTATGFASTFASLDNGGALTVVLTFPKGLYANKPCGRDRLAGTAGRLRTRR